MLGDLLGAHISTAGGMDRAPARAKAIGATAMQVFTKTPNQWREPAIDSHLARRFRAEVKRTDLKCVMAHDSYLINLASPNPLLTAKSMAAFTSELRRCQIFGIPFLVSHPGNYIDNRDAGLVRNARAYAACLRAVPRGPIILIETTAGTGTALGAEFEELARLRSLIPAPLRHRIGFCADTCHLFAAGYDLVDDFDGVWQSWDRALSLRHLRALHLNDSKTALGARRDRHQLIGEGTLGPEPFRRIMTDPRFAAIPKIIETPKGDDPPRSDRRMLRRLRGYRARRTRR